MPNIWSKKYRTWGTLALLTAFIGIGDISRPIDLFFDAFHAKFNRQAASGETVIIGVDDAAIDSFGEWPWSGDQFGKLTEDLFAAGADNVFFSNDFHSMDDADATAFADILRTYPQQVFLGATKDDFAGGKRDLLPHPALQEHAGIVSVTRYIKFWNGVEDVEYATRFGDETVPSLEAQLSGVKGSVEERFPINYSYQVGTIPYFSASQVASIRAAGNTPLDGKNVIVGLNSHDLTKSMVVLGQTQEPPVFVLALGAETLLGGRPLILGWLPVWLLACCMAFPILTREKWEHSVAAGYASLALLSIAPVILGRLGVSIQVSPAFLLIFFAATSANWRRFANRQRSTGSTNPISGLQTVNAIRHDDRKENRLVVAARIRRYTEIVSALANDGERAFVQEIIKRLNLCIGDNTLLHGDDGSFYWLADSNAAQELDDAFRAMTVIFRSPIKLGDETFDVDISFGTDQEFEVNLSQRFVTALAAACEAEQHEVCWKQHDPTQRAQRTLELTFRGELDRALLLGNIWVALQPQVCLKTGKLVGCEALARWTHETRGPIPPDMFIAMAERNNCIDVLTDFIMDESLKAAAEAQKFQPDLAVSVNISPRLLSNADLYDKVESSLKRHGFNPQHLNLEITESERVVHNQETADLMRRFRELGAGLSIDDYGTGLSTLEYLRKIPGTELKIDRSFTCDITTSKQDQTVIRSTIELAHALGMTAVVEGVETQESMDVCFQLGADIAQGYGISRPLPASDFIEWAKEFDKISENFKVAC